jgi:hypothetical protein
LTSIIIPDSVESIGVNVFIYTNLNTITFKTNPLLITINDNAFESFSVSGDIILDYPGATIFEIPSEWNLTD